MQLQKQTVERGTLSLLRKLMADARLQQFALAGGTALSLMIGHRQSIDLDLFSTEEFDAAELDLYLDFSYPYRQNTIKPSSLMCSIDGVKVDFVTFKHANIGQYQRVEGIRLYSPEDIAAMKLFAISLNPSRLKDYVDVAYLSRLFSLEQMLDFYTRRYPNRNPMQPYKMLYCFQQVNFDEPIKLQKGGYRWDTILRRLTAMKQDESKVFGTFPE